jgi:hypothetical protein
MHITQLRIFFANYLVYIQKKVTGFCHMIKPTFLLLHKQGEDDEHNQILVAGTGGVIQ